MLKILNIFKRKNKGSQEPTQEIKRFIGFKGTYSPYYFKILRWKYIVDKRSDKIVDILRGIE